jgi:hypothetical protein
MNEYHDLMSLLNKFRNLVKRDAVQEFTLKRAVSFALDSNEVLLQGDWPERRIEEEKALLARDSTPKEEKLTYLG